MKKILQRFWGVGNAAPPLPSNDNPLEQARQALAQFELAANTPSVFPYIAKSKIVSDLNERLNSGGSLVYQDENTCGLAAVCHIFAHADPLGYVQFTIDLYQFGAAKHRRYAIKPKEGIAQWAQTVKPTSTFDGADFVLMGSLRFVENFPNRFKITGAWDGLTWPWEVIRLGKDLVGLEYVRTPFWKNTQLAASLEPTLKTGNAYLVMLNTGSFAGGKLFGPWHYQLYLGNSTQSNSQFEFDYWDYARPARQKKSSMSNFNRNVFLIYFKKRS